MNLKNPIRNWIKRTTEVFSGERRRLQKPRGSKGVAQKKVPDKAELPRGGMRWRYVLYRQTKE